MAAHQAAFVQKLAGLDQEFKKTMAGANAKFFQDKVDDANLSPELKEHWEKWGNQMTDHTQKVEQRLDNHSQKYIGKMKQVTDAEEAALRGAAH